MKVTIKRIYDAASPSDGYRVLVDRLWPRGVSKADAWLDSWAKDLAPSAGLRQWVHEDVARWAEFERRYRAELQAQRGAVEQLLRAAGNRPLTLLYAAREPQRNHAVVLQHWLEERIANDSHWR
jgi:uncharacterized protein YeaO (DUF488 family)